MDERQRRIREEFIDARGYWNGFWDGLLQLDPDFFEAYLQFSGVPWKNGTLSPKFKELVYIAIDASTTHLYEPGLRQHIQNALRHGATSEEIMEVYELVSVLGIHACTLGVPVLLDELEQAGIDGRPAGLTDEQERIKQDFVERRGYWNDFWEGLLALDADFFQAYLEFSGIPWKNGTLAPKEKELIYIAIDAATTHLYEPGLRQHIQNALRHGATKEEIMEVYELISVLGIHACTLGVPVLLEEIETAAAAAAR
jgi:alkylhydroperoxidase/carboxymuconolactone decarboxylase family protein YurZ